MTTAADMARASRRFPVGARVRRSTPLEWSTNEATVVHADEYLHGASYDGSPRTDPRDGSVFLSHGDLYIALRWEDGGIGNQYPTQLVVLDCGRRRKEAA